MITSKQRAKLRGLANSLETIGQIGKGGMIDTIVAQTNDALTAREAAGELAAKTGAEIVQVIGYRFVLYRPNPQKPKDQRIQLG